ncbi:hypothetical protein [Streptomyces sp. GMR22]|uniref:hypothetical protein n=1 Tax=Streptomyces sp. GMR22 TaxID=2759524 RepID=UPI0015F978A9|nr:hypothetical protein [Streptomyces sp. GMR22]MBA6439680.1 hypothetical protein [Streptomyces sp. GMR22]
MTEIRDVNADLGQCDHLSRMAFNFGDHLRGQARHDMLGVRVIIPNAMGPGRSRCSLLPVDAGFSACCVKDAADLRRKFASLEDIVGLGRPGFQRP